MTSATTLWWVKTAMFTKGVDGVRLGLTLMATTSMALVSDECPG